MADQTLPADTPSESVCPWCSAAVVPGSPTCPSCGAILESDEDRDVPGVTAVDAAARLRPRSRARPRNRLLSWISGEYPDDAPSADPTPRRSRRPTHDVRREILRLELEAEVANLQAEADALLSEAVVEGRLDDLPEDVQPLATGESTPRRSPPRRPTRTGCPMPPPRRLRPTTDDRRTPPSRRRGRADRPTTRPRPPDGPRT